MSIIVRPIQATLIRDTELIVKMDPYCKIYLGGQCQQSNICHHGGKNPTWSSSLNFTTCGDMNLRVQVWDHQSLKHDDLVGAGNLNLGFMMQKPTDTVWVDLFYNGKTAGRVCLSIRFPGMGMGMGMGMNPMGMGMGINNNPMNNNTWGM